MNYKIGLILAALSLAACGGGGSGSNTLPQTPIPQPTGSERAMLQAGFGNGASTANSNVRRIESNVRVMSSPAPLTGQVQPLAIFTQPDSYLTLSMGDLLGTNAIAFYDPSKGQVPSPLPTVTWTQQGAGVGLKTDPLPNWNTSSVIVGMSSVSPGSALGHTIIWATASNGDKVTLGADAYHGGGLSSDPANRYGNPTSVTFDASGNSVPAAGTSGDIYLDASGDVTVVHTPYGGVLVPKNVVSTDINDDYLNPQTSLSVNLCAPNTTGLTILYMTHDGRYVKWSPAVYDIPDATKTCQWTNAYGPYGVSVNGAFPY